MQLSGKGSQLYKLVLDLQKPLFVKKLKKKKKLK